MDDLDEDLTPPPRHPAKPLPRIAKFAPPPDEEPDPPPTKTKSKKKDAASSKGSNGTKKKKEKTGVLLEETPEFDTYKTRQTVRIMVGVAGVAAVLLIGFIIASLVKSNEPAADVVGDQPAVQASPETQQADRLEREARVELNDARQIAKKGDGEGALKRLKRIVEKYPKTLTARESKEAVDRSEQGLPLFADVPLVVAKKEETKAEPEPPPPPQVVVAATPDTSKRQGSSHVEIVPPATSPEPRRLTGVPVDRADVPPLPLPKGFRARPEGGVHATGWPLEITCDRDGSSMVFIPGGTFMMGDDKGPREEWPAHKVTVSPYYIDQHEITAQQFAIYQKGVATKDAAGGSVAAPGEGANPAVNVSWNDATAYAEWAGKKLPTEAQWEFAARTPDSRRSPWGNSEANWDRPRAPKQVDPVMSFENDLSPYGVFDLAGNAWEWTADLFSANYYEQFRGKEVTNPTGPPKSRSRPVYTVKGGSKLWLSPWRSGFPPHVQLAYLGFRCVLPLGQSAPQVSPSAAPGTPQQQAPAPAQNGGGAPVPF